MNERLDRLLGKGAISPDVAAVVSVGHTTRKTGKAGKSGTAGSATSSTSLTDLWWMSTDTKKGSTFHLCSESGVPICGRQIKVWRRSRKAGPTSEWAIREMWGPLSGHPCDGCMSKATNIIEKEVLGV